MKDSNSSAQTDCQCPCGDVRYSLKKAPALRFFCHCDICKSVYQQDHSDFCVVWQKDVSLESNAPIEYQKYRRPPALDRGKCQSCQQAAIGFLSLLPGLKLAFVPSRNLTDQSLLPKSSGHLFYNQRAQDAKDVLPKHTGYINSEWAVSRAVLSRLVFS